jgi:hypothetical protein
VSRPVRGALLVLAGGALGVVGALAARLGGGPVLPWAVPVAAGLALGLLAAAALALPPADPVAALDAPPEPNRTTAFGDLAGLRFAVEQDSRDADRFETRLRPRLAALAVERLRLHHGLDWRAEQDRAAALPLLGPDLAALLTAPPHALRLTPQALARWTRDLEAL